MNEAIRQENMPVVLIVLEYIKVFIWPIITLVILFSFRKQIKNLFTRIHKAEFPGGVSIETFPDVINDAKQISKEVAKEEKDKQKEKISKTPSIPLNEVNTRLLNLKLGPSPSGLDLNYYRDISRKDPTLALAGLRIELESMLKNLATGFNVKINKADSASIIAKKLSDRGAITNKQYDLIESILQLSNAAIHGVKVTRSQAEDILEVAKVLRNQFIDWLSWGFENYKS